MTQYITLPIPEHLYERFEQVAKANQQSVTDLLLHAVEVGSPPSWADVTAEFQPDLAALDQLGEQALWQIARSQQGQAMMDRYEDLLHKNANEGLTTAEKEELANLRQEADRFTLRKAHAAALLRWKGHQPPSIHNFWQAYLDFREQWKDVAIDIEGDIWERIRDNSSAP